MRKSVAILGGGIGGLTAAHELAERGFDVVVYEKKDLPGGKARSIPVAGSATPDRRELPGEHGFRFFPGFYRHLVNTLERIPFGDDGAVVDNLVTTSHVQIARTGRNHVFTPAHYNDVWITPWRKHLERLGVNFRMSTSVEKIHFDGQRISNITISDDGEQEEIFADYYVAALPVDVIKGLVSDSLKQAAPSLAMLDRLRTAWMVGIQYYVDREVRIASGHTLYLDSPWALTSISQEQFWSHVDLSDFGDGRVKDVFSVDVSDWDTPGILIKKPARECTAEEIKEETWAQIMAHFGEQDAKNLKEAKVLNWFLDPAIVFDDEGSETINLEPLLINTPGSWDHRPDAVTEVENLMLAADYVRTSTDLASMEAANEAARIAVNGILDHCESAEARCDVWPLEEARAFSPLRFYDRMRFKRGLPHDPRPVKLLMRFPRFLQFFMDLWRKLKGKSRN